MKVPKRLTRTCRLAALILGLVLVALSAQAASRLTFSTPMELCANCHSHDIAVDAFGKVYAGWTTGPFGSGGFELWTSVDGGRTFTRANTPDPAIPGFSGNIAVASLGEIVHLIWMDLDLAGPQLCDGDASTPEVQPAPCYDVFYAKSQDGGRTFSAPRNISNADFGLYGPRIAIDGTGTTVNVVWNQATTGEGNICCAREIYFSRSADGGQTFSLPQNLSGPLHDSHNVAIATDDGSGSVINVAWWVSSDGGWVRQLYFVRSTDGGLTFSDPKLVVEGQSPSIASDAAGSIVNIAYVRDGIRFIRSTDGGGSFSSPVAISSVGYGPSVVADATGNRIDLVWWEGGGAKQWVKFARSSNGGKTFSKPLTIANVSQRYVVRPDLAVDPNGNINTIWAEWSSDTYISDIYYARGTP